MLHSTPKGLAGIEATFGKLDADFERKNIVSFSLPYPLLYAGKKVHMARCHRLLVDNFVAAFEGIARRGLQDEARNYGGIYAARNARGTSKPSTHSWGVAIDLEPNRYPLGSASRLPEGVIDAFAEAGFFYGGDFNGRKDPMHFQYCVGY